MPKAFCLYFRFLKKLCKSLSTRGIYDFSIPVLKFWEAWNAWNAFSKGVSKTYLLKVSSRAVTVVPLESRTERVKV